MKEISIKNRIIIYLLSLLHLLCDLICVFKVMQVLSYIYFFDHTLIFILYNGVAFLMQPLAGIIIDKFHKEKIMLIVSVVFIILGAVLNNLIFSCVFLGLANQLFHVIGGKMCANFSTKKAWHFGLFVSLGAIGLMLGSNFSNNTFLFLIPIIIYSVLIIAVCLLYEEKIQIHEEPIINKIKVSKKIFAVIFLIIVVFIRSFVGKIIHYGFEMNMTFIVLFGIACALGKFIGGILKDIFGSLKVIFVSLFLCGLILLFFENIFVLMFIGVILINISMPITLFELNKINPTHEGLNFGLLAAALFPGVAIGLVYQYEVISYTIFVILSIVLSIYGIYYVTRINKCGK